MSYGDWAQWKRRVLAMRSELGAECKCPEGIIKCAHLGDRVVWLGDHKQAMPHDTGRTAMNRWGVLGPSKAEQCPCSAKHLVVADEEAGWAIGYYNTDSLAKAEAEFERRTELLRSEA